MTQDKENLITFDKDLMFCTVMKHKKPCIKFLESVLEKKIKDVQVREVNVQKFLASHPTKKAIFLDVFFEDDTTMYNIEMQSADNDNLINRATFYDALMLAGSVPKGKLNYKDLKSRYVIFLCTFDPFKNYNQKCYQIESVCKNVKDLPIEDGRHILFLNTKGVDGKISTDLEALFEYINGGEASIGKETDNELVKLIDDCVEKTNADEQWRVEYMKYYFDMQDQYDKGVAETEAVYKVKVAEAEAQYKAKEAQYKAKEAKYKANVAQYKAKAKEEKANMIKDLYAKNVPIQTIAECGHLSEAEVQAIIASK